MTYYGITTLTDDVAYPDQRWSEEIKASWSNGCMHLVEGHPLDIYLRYNIPELPLNILVGFSISIAHISFLKDLVGTIDNYFETGRVIGKNNKIYNDLVTFRLKNKKLFIRVRGGPKSTRQFCNKCGKFLYYPLEHNYILKSDLTTSEIYESNFAQLILSKSKISMIDKWLLNKSSKLEVVEIPILKKPIDGLPIDLNLIKPGDVEEWGFGEKTKGIRW